MNTPPIFSTVENVVAGTGRGGYNTNDVQADQINTWKIRDPHPRIAIELFVVVPLTIFLLHNS